MAKKLLLALIFCSILSSCGFQIIYREAEGENQSSYEKELATIRIQKEGGRLSQEVRNALKDSFNPDYIDVEPKYILQLNISKGISGTFITVTGASGRNRVTLTLEYTLLDATTGKTLSTGIATVSDNYDVQINRYGTYVAEDYARSNLAKIAATDIRNLLVNDLIELKKNGNKKQKMHLVNGVYPEEKTKEEKEKLAAENAEISCSGAELKVPEDINDSRPYK